MHLINPLGRDPTVLHTVTEPRVLLPRERETRATRRTQRGNHSCASLRRERTSVHNRSLTHEGMAPLRAWVEGEKEVQLWRKTRVRPAPQRHHNDLNHYIGRFIILTPRPASATEEVVGSPDPLQSKVDHVFFLHFAREFNSMISLV